MARDREKNRSRNDELREHLLGGGTIASPKIAALDLSTLRRLIERLARYRGFSETSDQFDDHAFGAFDFESATVVFKIEVISFAPPPSSRSSIIDLDERVMTIMLAEEYGLPGCPENEV